MGKIKDFFTKIGVTDSDGEEGFQNTTADTKQADNSVKEEPAPQNGRNINNSQDEERPAEPVGNDFSRGHSSKVVNIGSTAGSIREGGKTYTTTHGVYRRADNMKVVVIQPRSLDDSQQIANCLKEKRPVVINFEGVDDQLYRRILDFVSGTTYALDGNVNSISSRVWLFAPKNVNVAVKKQGNNDQGDMPWEKK